MSYILEALKKAESERKLGSVPNMHAQPLVTASAAGSPFWRTPLAWSVLVAVLLLAAVIAWLAPWQAGTVVSLPQQTSSGSVSMDTNPAPVPDTAIPPIAQAPTARQVPEPPHDVVPAEPAKPKAAPKPAIKKKIEPAKAPVAAQPAERKKEIAAAAMAPAAEPRLPALRELPENIQREIPTLAVSGYIYSSVPAERSVLINNRLLREGSEIAPGLMLEKMLPKEAVLNYRGTRYRIPY